MAYPQRYVLDPSIIGTPDADKAKAACKYGAIDLDMQEETIELKVGAVIWATGWKPYDAAKIQPYGYGRFANVITSVEFERLADPHGPTGGKLLRPSDGKEAKNIAFIQCAGSRDENHLRHCSRICCMASLKQTQYVREAYGDDGKSTIYYIDIRAIDRFEDFYQKVQKDPTVQLRQVQGGAHRAGRGDRQPGRCTAWTPKAITATRRAHDLVVLAVGMEPSVKGIDIPGRHRRAIRAASSKAIRPTAAMFGAGCASSPLDVNRAVQSATAAALRAIQVINKAARGGGVKHGRHESRRVHLRRAAAWASASTRRSWPRSRRRKARCTLVQASTTSCATPTACR